MDLQKEIDQLDCKNAERRLARLGGVGSVEYYTVYRFIQEVKKLQNKPKLAALLKEKPNEA